MIPDLPVEMVFCYHPHPQGPHVRNVHLDRLDLLALRDPKDYPDLKEMPVRLMKHINIFITLHQFKIFRNSWKRWNSRQGWTSGSSWSYW